ncbi:MAG: hypothetical protein KDG50_14310 [Chromatiales bacterium]|nr:hypothetical protein [Chromatiales bacterium]
MLRWLQDRVTRPFDAQAFVKTLGSPQVPDLGLNAALRGIDNIHIDAALFPGFRKSLVGVLERLMRQCAARLVGDRTADPAFETEEATQFSGGYQMMMDIAILRARRDRSLVPIQVLQLATTKFLLASSATAFRALTDRLRSARYAASEQSSGRSLELQQRIVLLARRGAAAQYEVNRLLFDQFDRAETRRLAKQRKAITGRSWPIPRRILFNPLVQLPTLRDANLLIEHYPLFHDAAGRACFAELNRRALTCFAALLPEDITIAVRGTMDGVSSGPIERIDEGGLAGFLETEMLLKDVLAAQEYQQPLSTWFDDPNVVERITKAEANEAYREILRQQDDRDGLRQYDATVRVQRQFADRWFEALQRDRMLHAAAAGYEVSKLNVAFQYTVPVETLHAYVADPRGQRHLRRKIETLSETAPEPVDLNLLEQTAEHVHSRATHGARELAAQYLVDFARFRRDLKYAYLLFRAMEQVRVLSAESDLTLSRTNSTLYDFAPDASARPANEAREARHHVVIKADLRGSTILTEQLLKRGLNPASHFSVNFYTPIDKLIGEFEAEKVFIEGDAIILALYEYTNTRSERLTVARACGLAREILRVVQAQNDQIRKYDVPALEIGIGIAIAPGKPTFLYDGERRITISPAISAADRASSSSSLARKGATATQNRVRSFERDGEKLWHNVDGIALSPDGFARLRRDVSLHRIEIDLFEDGRMERVYAGRYPDGAGNLRWLIVREVHPEPWPGSSGIGLPEGEPAFYEVVTPAGALSNVRKALAAGRATEDPGGVPG